MEHVPAPVLPARSWPCPAPATSSGRLVASRKAVLLVEPSSAWVNFTSTREVSSAVSFPEDAGRSGRGCRIARGPKAAFLRHQRARLTLPPCRGGGACCLQRCSSPQVETPAGGWSCPWAALGPRCRHRCWARSWGAGRPPHCSTRALVTCSKSPGGSVTEQRVKSPRPVPLPRCTRRSRLLAPSSGFRPHGLVGRHQKNGGHGEEKPSGLRAGCPPHCSGWRGGERSRWHPRCVEATSSVRGFPASWCRRSPSGLGLAQSCNHEEQDLPSAVGGLRGAGLRAVSPPPVLPAPIPRATRGPGPPPPWCFCGAAVPVLPRRGEEGTPGPTPAVDGARRRRVLRLYNTFQGKFVCLYLCQALTVWAEFFRARSASG